MLTEPAETLFGRGPNGSMKLECFRGCRRTSNQHTRSCYDELGYYIEYGALPFYKNIEAMIAILEKVANECADASLAAGAAVCGLRSGPQPLSSPQTPPPPGHRDTIGDSICRLL